MDNNLKEIQKAINDMEFISGENFNQSVEKMIQPILFKGFFGTSYTRIVSGLQYHLSGEHDTRELADLAKITSKDIILDECCFIGGPALQIAEEYRCQVIGVDSMNTAIFAANEMAKLTNLSSLACFRIGDAKKLDFPDNYFTVTWNQCSLEHDEKWLDELDRVLKPQGRMALTFQSVTGERNPKDPFGRWTIDDLEDILKGKGYSIINKTDITERDIKLGWKKLINKLHDNRDLYASVFGGEWVNKAQEDFKQCILDMQERKYGNGRIVAQKQAR